MTDEKPLPTLEEMTVLMTKHLHTHGIISSCVSCTHFEGFSERCILAKPPERPPAKVIAVGCPAWSEGLPY